MLSTQLRALEEVTTLATEDPYIRQVLSSVLRDSYVTPKYKERELYVSCCKARIAIKENEVHEFWLRFAQKNKYSPEKQDYRDDVWFKHRAARYFRYANNPHPFTSFIIINAMSRDPDLSFFLGRLLCASIRGYPSLTYDAQALACKIFVNAAATNPQIVEWDTLSNVLTSAYFGRFAFIQETESFLSNNGVAMILR